MCSFINLEYAVFNAFTHSPISGNPVAIFYESEKLSASLMQSIASQLQLSETTFLQTSHDKKNAEVRIFTPVNELSFAGHPLMGTAAAYARKYGVDDFVFHTKKGPASVSVKNISDNVSEVEIAVPLAKPQFFSEKKELLNALGLERSELPIEIYDAGARHVLVSVSDKSVLHNINPDHKALEAFENMAINCFCWDGDNIENRMFSPAYGVKEDAGTGSVVWPIAQHLIQYDQFSLDKKLMILQGTQLSRQSEMYGEIKSDQGIGTHAILSGYVYYFSDCLARV
ncbi:Trans-2,3-dihydro-3-hydroxyanthranilate isomerase [Vibrio crassostreae]|uniref:PhzF family phenazine biosynthesis protein n=1 Tax=Vibrio crassostreae TaxID=246167 RepID=UPI00104FB4F8|nr:PhzF family phenazine biosynthesis protein [Vibrio crassostreae]TCN75904.1 trans-2,3-dihydro-3-hydroxyanthranilate isomerase [Vibrio crassostreae]CAK2533185.1 Trans-2,3-dihydro-3-hydroxyanthranilate isomerase [Vibrio crassostreae]CAK3889223.1 Trans-2,3-dihydro-3-hydroxyanthranilate isomerase [Vibrio crassostreae]